MQKLQQSLEDRIITNLEIGGQTALYIVQPEVPKIAPKVEQATTEEQFEQIESLEVKYRRKKRNESALRGFGRGAVLASLLAAGALMSFSESEKKDVNIRIATDLIAATTSVITSIWAYGLADSERKKAAVIAEKAILISHELRIDPPYWTRD